MKRKKKKVGKITLEDYIKAIKKANREAELSEFNGWRRTTSIHKNKKAYDRKLAKKNIPDE